MFSKKKDVKKERKPRPAGSLAQYGIFEIPESLGDLGGSIDNDDTDEDFEAELAALTAGDLPHRKAPRKPPSKPIANLDSLISDSIKEINSDEELSGDDDDPDLLNELKAITGDTIIDEQDVSDHTNDTTNETTKLLEERLLMYKTAENKAKSENESARARRFNRGIKTLEKLLSSCKLGNEIDSGEIPPVLPSSALGEIAEKPPTEVAQITSESDISPETEDTSEILISENDTVENEPETNLKESPSVQIDEETLNMLKARQKEYKIAALAWKKAGNHEEAVNHIRITKQFEAVIAMVSQGNAIDLSDMPPQPSLPNQVAVSTNPIDEAKEENANQGSSAIQLQPSAPNMESLESALKERLEVYRRSKTLAESEENSSKVRRYGRICKQFEDALKRHAQGKPIVIEDLPTPPGFPPLSSIGDLSASANNQPSSSTVISEPSKPVDEPEPTKPSPLKETKPATPPRTNLDKKKKLTSRVDKQIEVLQQRQRELKMAALKAKKDGDLDLARDYLRQAKGIEPLLEASLAGLPVNMNSIPLSPEAKLLLDNQDSDSVKVSNEGFTVISSMDCSEEATGTDEQIYENLEKQLKKQMKWCLTTRDHCKALGDVASYNKWSRLALDYTKDLDMLRVRKRDNLPPPQHHYEIKTYSIVQSCTDLTDGDIEISIIRGINYAKEVDSYVIFEFPWPSDSPTNDRTSTIRDSNNPEYNATFPLTGIIDRKSRQCTRVFKRHSLKCQVWSKGGFFRADSLIGTANIKLQPLETECVLHDSFPLMEGRKSIGCKLEVKIRLRNPITTKQIEQNTDKWLTIDH